MQDRICETACHLYNRTELFSNDSMKHIYLALDKLAFTHPVWNKVFRRAFLIQYSISFPTGIFVSEDYLFNLQVYGNTEKMLIIDVPLYYYIHYSSSLTTQFKLSKLDNIEQVYLDSISFFENWLPSNCNQVKNVYFRDVRVFINNMYNPGVDLSNNDRRKIIKNILSRKSVIECISTIECVGLRNKIFYALIKTKSELLLQYMGKISRIVRL